MAALGEALLQPPPAPLGWDPKSEATNVSGKEPMSPLSDSTISQHHSDTWDGPLCSEYSEAERGRTQGSRRGPPGGLPGGGDDNRDLEAGGIRQ